MNNSIKYALYTLEYLQSLKQLVTSRFSWYEANERCLGERQIAYTSQCPCFLKGEGEGEKGAVGEGFLFTAEHGAQPHVDP